MSEPQDLGKVEIFDNVIGTIAGVAISGIAGIAGMRGTFIDGIKKATTGRKDFSAGVEVRKEPDGKRHIIDMYIIIDYNVNVMAVAANAQKAVKQKVEEITGITISSVNIHVSDIRLPESLVERATDL
ncbi:MAG: Asp23/Gls24 family envelope stress response protein [bacterium]